MLGFSKCKYRVTFLSSLESKCDLLAVYSHVYMIRLYVLVSLFRRKISDARSERETARDHHHEMKTFVVKKCVW